VQQVQSQVLDITGGLDVSGALTTGSYAGDSAIVTVGTLTSGTIDLGQVTVTGSTTEFDTALQSDTFVFASDNITALTATTKANFDAEVSDGTIAFENDANTFTSNQTIDIGGVDSNLIIGGNNDLADATNIGAIKFHATGDVGGSPAEDTFCEIRAVMSDDTTATEDATLQIYAYRTGTYRLIAQFNSAALNRFYAGANEVFRTQAAGISIPSGNSIGYDNIQLSAATQTVTGTTGTGVVWDTTDAADIWDFQINSTSTFTINPTTVNVPSGVTFQENSVDISPIGVHDIWIGAPGMWESTTGGCAALTKTELATDQDIQTLDFDGASVEAAQFEVALPKNYNAGTVTATFYWSSTATDTGDVDWRISGVSHADGEVLTGAYGSAITVTDANQSVANDTLISAATSAITIAGAGKSEFVRFLVERDGASDTASEDARLHGVMLHITTDAANAD
jgi:hypothetical protein